MTPDPNCAHGDPWLAAFMILLVAVAIYLGVTNKSPGSGA